MRMNPPLHLTYFTGLTVSLLAQQGDQAILTRQVATTYGEKGSLIGRITLNVVQPVLIVTRDVSWSVFCAVVDLEKPVMSVNVMKAMRKNFMVGRF